MIIVAIDKKVLFSVVTLISRTHFIYQLMRMMFKTKNLYLTTST